MSRTQTPGPSLPVGTVPGGDLAGSTYPSPTLVPTGVTPGTYGSGSAIPILHVDAKGRVLSASAASITIVGLPGQQLNADLAMSSRYLTTSSTPVVVGGASFDAADYALTNTSTSFTFVAMGAVASGTLNVELVDITNDVTLATLTFTSAAPTALSSPALSLASGSVSYEVRLIYLGQDSGYIDNAGISVTNTIT
jgi:hypothetical protein